MRKMLLSLTVFAGVAALASGAEAAPRVVTAPMLDASAYVQPVQYYGDWRREEWRRRQRHMEWRRHQEWRRDHWRRY